MATPSPIPNRGYLLHVTHYDPTWTRRKPREKPFDAAVGLELVDAAADAGLNLLVVDCADGVRYRSHPELKRHYSVPMQDLRRIAARARRQGLDVVPKLNFSQSSWHCHNHWFRPHHNLFDSDEYFRLAFELIDELIEVCRPEKYFHIGMDEDHHRSHRLYVEAIKTLRAGLKKRKLRTIIWNDTSACDVKRSNVHAEKCRAAEPHLPKDIIQILWDYYAVRLRHIRRIRGRGFELWGAPGRDAAHVRKWRRALQKHGGNGMLLTRWIPCRPGNRRELLNLIRTLGPLYGETD